MRVATPNHEMAATADVDQPAVEQVTDKEQHNDETSEIAQKHDEQQQDAQEKNEQATPAANRPPVNQENGQEKDKGAMAADDQNEGKLPICYFCYFLFDFIPDILI